MTFDNYLACFDAILAGKNIQDPYSDSVYLEYTKLNFYRMKRWLKTGEISSELSTIIKQISEKQVWIVISEPWCGDAAHILPFIKLLEELNSNIQLEIQIRDANSEIEHYLTDGKKGIPKFIVRNEQNEDLFVWGPRPEKCQEFFLSLKNEKLSSEKQKEALQHWYNEDKGQSLQEELLFLFQKIN